MVHGKVEMLTDAKAKELRSSASKSDSKASKDAEDEAIV